MPSLIVSHRLSHGLVMSLALWTFVLTHFASADDAAKPLLTFGEKPVTIVCLGDSVTGVYYHTGGRRAYPEMLEVAIKLAVPTANVTVVNAGISGHTTQNGLDRLDRDVLSKKPDLVTVSFGLNDMTRIPEDQFRKNLETIVARCREVKAEVVFCTPNAVITTGGRPTEKLERYCEVIRETARDLKLAVCDQYRAGRRAAEARRLGLATDAQRCDPSQYGRPQTDGRRTLPHDHRQGGVVEGSRSAVTGDLEDARIGEAVEADSRVGDAAVR